MIACIFYSLFFIIFYHIVEEKMPDWVGVIIAVVALGCFFAASVIWDKHKENIEKLQADIDKRAEELKELTEWINKQ